MREHWIMAPLDYFGALTLLASGVDARMVPNRINVFAREYIRDGHEDAPRLVFFQGGPGSAAPRMAPIGSWLDTALNYFRVVLIDERGTGNSHPLEKTAVTSVGTPEVQAAYLSCFRQDSIVRDAAKSCRAISRGRCSAKALAASLSPATSRKSPQASPKPSLPRAYRLPQSTPTRSTASRIAL